MNQAARAFTVDRDAGQRLIVSRPTQLYPGGPVRLFSTTRFQGQGSIPYSDGKRKGFIGLYLCTACGGPTLRVLARRKPMALFVVRDALWVGRGGQAARP